MPQFVSAYPGNLILPGPDAETIEPGQPVDLTDDHLQNKAVKEWIDAEWLVPAKEKTKKRLGLEKQADALDLAYSEETTDDELIEAIKEAKAGQ